MTKATAGREAGPRAERGEDSRLARVRPLVEKARVHLAAGRYAEALALYKLAHGMVARREISYGEAAALEGQGRLLDAIDVLDRALTEPPYDELQARISKGLLRLLRRLRLARLELMVKPLGAHVVVDGRRRGQAPLRPLDLPLGWHTVVVTAPGCVDHSRRVHLENSGVRTMDATLKCDVDTEGPRWYDSIGGWVTLGAGVGLVAGGGALLGVAESERDEIRGATSDPPVTTMSQDSAFEKRDEADRKEIAGAVLLGLGAASVAASVVLFLLHPGAEETTDTAVRWTPTFLPGGAGGSLEVRFR